MWADDKHAVKEKKGPQQKKRKEEKGQKKTKEDTHSHTQQTNLLFLYPFIYLFPVPRFLFWWFLLLLSSSSSLLTNDDDDNDDDDDDGCVIAFDFSLSRLCARPR